MTTETQAPAIETVAQKDVDAARVKLAEKFSKRGKLLMSASDAAGMVAFSGIVREIATMNSGDTEEPNPNFVDWTQKAPDAWDNYALVKVDTEDSKGNPTVNAGHIRLVSIADQATALADPTVAAYLYRLYQGRIMNLATGDDEQEASFIVVNGAFKVSFAEEAFDNLAGEFIKALRLQKVEGITKSKLREALGNAQFAKSMFPRITSDNWVKMIGVMKSIAQSKGMDVSLYDHFLTTRDAFTSDAGEEIKLNFDVLKAVGSPAPAAAPVSEIVQAETGVPASPAP